MSRQPPESPRVKPPDGSVGEFLFRETALNRASFLRDFAPAFVIMGVALGLAAWLPVEADTGLRPVEASALVIFGSLAAVYWVIGRRLSRIRRRVLGVSPDAIRIYPPRSPLALPGNGAPAQTTIPRDDVIGIEVAGISTIAGRLVRRRFGTRLCEYRVRTRDGAHRFDDLCWSPDIDTMTRLERDARPAGSHRRPDSSLEAALRQTGYPVGAG